MPNSIAELFQMARERESIRRKRLSGQPPPWTDDEVLQKYRFCNVHREDDKTTIWFREHVREPLNQLCTNGNLKSRLKLVESTLIARWFNRIETLERIQDLLVGTWNTEEARSRLQNVRPVVTGAYMLRTPTGMSKLDGILYLVDQAKPQLASIVGRWGPSLELATEDLTQIYSLGPFLAYEIVTDLRWTVVLNQAADIMLWANAGPGAARGLGRAFHNDFWHWNRGIADHQIEMVGAMRELVRLSQDPQNWPSEWEPWEMRTAEHISCEYQKWCAGHEKQHLKRLFQP